MKTRLVPDPDQPFDHEGNPEDGPERFVEITIDPTRISPELELQIIRRRAERVALDELARYEANPPHRPKITCPRCTRDYFEVGSSNGYCAVCIVELEHCAVAQIALEDIHP